MLVGSIQMLFGYIGADFIRVQYSWKRVIIIVTKTSSNGLLDSLSLNRIRPVCACGSE